MTLMVDPLVQVVMFVFVNSMNNGRTAVELKAGLQMTDIHDA